MSSLVFIDSRVQDYERLISGFGTDVQVVLLDPAQDGIAQIAAALAGSTNLDSIHIVSHGSSGTLYLGSTVLTGDSLDDYEEELAQIGASLSEDGDLLLYGCNVAAGEAGESFIASLAEYTGADVAASTDFTGSSAAGGDWTLEAATGAIDAEVVLSTDAQASYAYLLATGLVITGTSGADSLTGSTIDDEIYGLEGNDTLFGEGGNDLVAGDIGNDILSGGPGNDTLQGGEGSDSFDLNTSPGDDSLVGGAGDDIFNDNRGHNTLAGGAGADTFNLGSTLDPATGSNVATGGTGTDLYVLGAWVDVFTDILYDTDYAVTDFATGAEDDRLDVISLTALSARLGGYAAGNPFDQDFLRLRQVGADTVLEWDPDGAGTDYDWFTAITLQNVTTGNVDTANFVGGLAPLGGAISGQSTTGSASADTLLGGYGNDTLNGVGGNDRIFGGAGNDSVDGGLANDRLDGGVGNDTLLGNDGDDTFTLVQGGGGGGYGNDSLDGGIGDDSFFDDWGDNTLVGGAGADTFTVGSRDVETGSNLVTGGADADTYEIFYPFQQVSLALGDELTSTVFLDRDYTVTDFTAGASGDLLDVGLLLNKSAALGYYESGNPFSGALGFLRLLQWGTDTRLQWDPDGTGSVYGWVTTITLQNETATGVVAANIVGGIPTTGAALTDQSFSGTAANETFTGGYGNDTINGNTGDDLLIGGGGDDTIVGGPETVAGGTADNDRMEGNLGNDFIAGGAGDDEFGNPSNGNDEYGNDTLNGGGGNDTFWDFWGHNVISGGAGDDYFSTFTFDDGIGSTVATGGPGQDTYELVPKSTALGPSVSRVYVVTDFAVGAGGDLMDVSFPLAFAAINGGYSSGSPFNPAIGVLRFVQSGPDTLLQWDRDGVLTTHSWITMLTLQGIDKATITSDNFIGKLIVGTPGDDALVGGLGNDTIQGLAGNDLLDGSLGADSMEGGEGGDIYFVDDAGDLVVETSNAVPLVPGAQVAALGDFTDTIVAAITSSLGDVPFVENLTLSNDPLQCPGGVLPTTGTGNVLNNIITGNSVANVLNGVDGHDTLHGGGGGDTLSGGGGNDSMAGGAGNDTYLVNGTADVVTETGSGGIDLVQSSVTIAALWANVEKLTLTGGANLNGAGNALANTITGNAGANVLNGLGANDTMAGGAGNDTYVLNSAGDTVTETSLGGADLIQSSVTIAALAVHVEKLTLTGAANLNGAGNTLANTITGNAGANTLSGLAGNDTLAGGGGNDVLAGGAGKDTLTGGAGLDRFDFNAALNPATNVDRIADFSPVSDLIRLDEDIFTALAAGNLTAVAFRSGPNINTAGDASDRIIYNETNGNLYYDRDGTGAAAAKLFATLTGAPGIDQTDFLIVA